MRLIKIILISLLTTSLFAKKIELSDMYITTFINMVANNINKNIMLNSNLDGEINFNLKNRFDSKDLYPLLKDILQSRRYLIEDKNLGYLELIALDNNSTMLKSNKDLITKVIEVKPETIDESIEKVNHLLSKDAEMVINRDLNLIILSEYPENLTTLDKIIGSIQNENEVIVQFINLKYAKTYDVIKNITNLLDLLFKNEKVEVIGDDIRNSIILITSRKNIYKLKPYIQKFDVVNKITTKKVEVFNLKSLNHTKALEILNSIFQKNNDIKITDDSSSNSIIVFATEQELQYIRDIIHNLDRQKEQVYIKVRILEIDEDNWHNFKKRYSVSTAPLLSGNDFVNLNLLITQKVVDTISNHSSEKNLYDINELIFNKESNLSKEIMDIPQSYLLASTLSLLNLANALHIVSEPTILSLSNEDVFINIHKMENSETFNKFGVELNITPRVLNSNRVRLDISLKFKSALTKNNEIRDFDTKVVLGDSESLIINGLKNEFAQKSFFTKNSRKNLMFIFTPYILEKDQSISDFEEKLAHLNRLESEYAKKISNLLKAVEKEDRDTYSVIK